MKHQSALPTRSSTALLVGTEQMLLYTRKAILEQQNFYVRTTDPGRAVDLLRTCDFDVVISCHTMAPEEADRVAEAARAKERIPGLIRFSRQSAPAVSLRAYDASVWSLSTPTALIECVLAVMSPPRN